MNTSLKTFKRIFTFLQLILIALAAASIIKAQTSGIDLFFNAVVEKNSTSAAKFLLQPDNKVIVYSNFQAVNGLAGNRIARLNADGSRDDTFNCAICNFTITGAVLQPDGKILLSWGATIYRLNPDGSRDETFVSPFLPPTNALNEGAYVRAIQPDGKILAVFSRFVPGGATYNIYELYRLNADGTFDGSFNKITVAEYLGGAALQFESAKVAVLPGGKILVAANLHYFTPQGKLRRYNADGTPDATLETLSLTNNGNSNPDSTFINDFEALPDGSVVIVGRFTTVNELSRSNVAKILPNGNVDSSFNTFGVGEANRIKHLPDGKFIVGTTSRLHRLNADGSVDNSFASPGNLTQVSDWTLDSAGTIVLLGVFLENGASVTKFARLNQDGSVASSFTANLGIAASTTALAAHPDGKVVFAGDFVRVSNVPRVSIARVNADGSLDATFDAGSGFNGAVSKIIIQPDGKILVAGNFSAYNGALRRAVARLNADGSLDGAFNLNPLSGTISTMALQPDGKILLGGTFVNDLGQTRLDVVRFNPDGSFDASFDPAFPGGSIRSIVVKTDGKILVGGSFVGVNGFNRANLVRLNADGNLDLSFDAGAVLAVNQIEILPDGRYLVLTVDFTIVRLNNNGARDTTFLSPIFRASSSGSAIVFQILALPDGSILVGGSFSMVNDASRANFARLRPNGALDSGFIPSGANGIVRTFARQNDGRVLVGGDFSIIGGVTRVSIARLNVAPYRLITPYDYDGDGRADVAVFRPSNGNWYILPSQSNNFYGFPFGQAGDRIAPADYDGDGKTDVAVFRDVVPGAGNFAYFYILNSADNSFRPAQFGATGDVPMAGDWDGDGKGDLAVYRDGSLAGGQSYFFYRPSSQPGVNFYSIPLGATGDKPLLGDFDGDGRLDPAVFRPSNAGWYILRSSINQITQTTFGLSSDIPTPADFDGDGQTNIAVFRPSSGTWFTSTSPQSNYGAVQFGAGGDVPVPADYDGDGRADVAVFRPSNGAWYLNRSTQGFTGVSFGDVNDKPIPNAYIR